MRLRRVRAALGGGKRLLLEFFLGIQLPFRILPEMPRPVASQLPGFYGVRLQNADDMKCLPPGGGVAPTPPAC